MYHGEPSLALWDDLEGWDGEGREGRERGHVCIIMVGLPCCMAEINTVL